MPRLVFDSGVLLSAAIKQSGVCGRLLTEVLSNQWEIIVCPMLLAELNRVLRRPKFHSYLNEDEIDQFLVHLSRVVRHEPDPRDVRPVTADPADDYLIALAADTRADWLVSGDAHLRNLTDVDVMVVSPGRMLEIIQRHPE